MSAFSKTSLPPVARVGDSADILSGLRGDTSAARIPTIILTPRRTEQPTAPVEFLELPSVVVRRGATRLKQRRRPKEKPRSR